MYEKRFGLHRKPFQAVQKPTDYYTSAVYKQLLPAVLNALQSDLGVAVLTGPSGVGKSVTLESFRRALEPSAQTLVVRGGAVRNSDELLYALHRHLLTAQKADVVESSRATVRRWDVVERLQRLSEFWGPLTILLDDVHLVKVDVFSELRSLLEEEAGGQKLIRLLIAGPLQLEEVLAQPSLEDFAQKIRTHVFLEPLRTAESVEYLAHHVTNAGGALENLFESTAVEKIVVAADGMPRCLNLLADESLMICEETDQNRVTPEIVNKALSRLLHLPVSWNASLDRDEPDSDDENFEPDSPASDSVVEIGGTVEEVSHGVIEFGAPSDDVPTSQPFHEVAEAAVESAESATVTCLEVGSDICEFITEDEICRDKGLIEHIGEISDAIDSVGSTDVQFDFCSDLFDGIEIGDSEFAEEAKADRIIDGPIVNDEQFEPMPHLDDAAEDVGWPSSELQADAESADSLIVDETCDNLEHHLLLAADESIEEDAPLNEELTPQESETDFENEHLFAAILSKSEPVDQFEERFSSYTRWEPAGHWPPVIAEPPSELLSYASQLGNASPVFDRYTWCELGRPVSPEPLSRRSQVKTTMTTVAEWPPSVSGIAPECSIAIEDVCDDNSELIHDTHAVPEGQVTKTGPTTEGDSITVDFTVGESLTLSELSLSISADDEQSFPENQEGFLAIQTDSDNTASDKLSQQTTANDDALPYEAPSVAERPVGNVSTAMDEMTQPAPTASTEYLRDASEVSIVTEPSPTADSGSEDQDSMDVLDNTTDVAALIANAVQRYISDTDSPKRDAGMSGQSTPMSPGGSERLLIAGEEVAEESVEEYAPKLLQEARARVISVLAAQGQLKQAAGAETSAIPVSSTEDRTINDRPHLSISRHFDDDATATEEQNTAESKASGPRFRDLFTRLRNLKRPSA